MLWRTPILTPLNEDRPSPTVFIHSLLTPLFYAVIFFLSSPLMGQDAYIQYTNEAHQFEVKNLDEPASNPKSAKSANWGNFFWEFGDGHYSFDANPTHQYAHEGLYELKAFLTPHYSFSEPQEITRKIASPGSDMLLPNYSLNNKWVSIESTGRDYLVPNQKMQFVIHYQVPPGSDIEQGYLLLFFNKKSEKESFKIKFNPLVFLEERMYYDEDALGDDFFSLDETGISKEGLVAAKKLFNAHEQLRLFKVNQTQQGREQRLFCTITSDERLAEYQDKNRELSLTALWLPANGSFDSRKNQQVHNMEILEVHDPNRIKVNKKTTYYLRKHRTNLFYKVDFQNKAKGVVEDVIIRIPIPKELDVAALNILEEKLDPVLSLCEGEDNEGLPCYKLATKVLPLQDSLIFTFQNIGLEGTKGKGFFQNKKNTKGTLAFSIQNKQLKKAITQLKADIYFKGSREIIQTQITSTKWRQQSININIGQNFHQTATRYLNSAKGYKQQYNIGVSILDAPLGKGILLGLHAGVTTFQFTRTTIDNVRPNSLLSNGGILYRKDEIQLNNFEGKVLGGYQINRFLRFFAGAGLSIPLKSRLDVESYYAAAIDNNPISYEQTSSTAGLLAQSSPAELFGKPFDAKNSIGLYGSMAIEVGLPNDLAIGLTHEIRHFPKFYNHSCIWVRNWQIYLRGKIGAFRLGKS